MYDLSTIPCFTTFMSSGKIDEKFDKYYSSKSFNSKEDNKEYTILRYNKDLLTPDLITTYGLIRSAIFCENKLISFSPPKSLNMDTFLIKYPPKCPDVFAEEFIEGTMINVFCENNTSWNISTRNNIGGNVRFFSNSNKTFRQMFQETCTINGFDYEKLNPNYCYSFVLQHPENRIVVPFKTPQLYLIAVYEILQNNNEIKIQEKNIHELIEMNHLLEKNAFKVPTQYEFTSYTELVERFGSRNTPYNIMGVILKNSYTGERTKIRNPVYEEVRHLRGNQSKLQYQYICLRQTGKIAEFLNYYPEYKKDFSVFRDVIHAFTSQLHKNYISCYIKREQQLVSFSPQYKTHMYNLHQHYLNDLRSQSLFISNKEVIQYVNKLPPSLLMYSLNYNLRQRTIDIRKASIQDK